MTRKIIGSHDFQQVICTVANQEITGYAEAGGLEFEMGSDITESVTGAQGEHFVSKNNDDSMIVTITVMQNSNGSRLLGGLLNLQETTPGPLVTVPFFMRNFVTGEIVKDSQAYFSTRPAPNQQRSQSERQYTLVLPFAAREIQYG